MIELLHIKPSRFYFKLTAVALVIILGCGYLGLIVVSVDRTTSTTTPTQTTTWIKLENDYSGAEYRDVEFINSSHGWVVGILYPNITRGGIILHTEDGGLNWETQLSDDSQLFRQIDIVNERTIWVTGLGCLYFTNDSGTSWHTSIALGGLSGMSTVKFINETHGWTATKRILFKTTDGGHSWQNVTGWTFDDHPREMHFLTESNVWVIGFDGIYHSNDGGETWAEVFDHGGWSLTFPGDNVAWGISDSYLLHMKIDQTWEILPVPGRLPSFRLKPPYCTDIQFIDEQKGWIVGTEIPIMHTPDGGITWYQQSVPARIGNRIMAVCFVDESHGWAVSSGGCILRTSTGGNLDAFLFSGAQDLLFIGIAAAGIVVALTAGRSIIHRVKHLRYTNQDSIEQESTTELH